MSKMTSKLFNDIGGGQKSSKSCIRSLWIPTKLEIIFLFIFYDIVPKIVKVS